MVLCGYQRTEAGRAGGEGIFFLRTPWFAVDLVWNLHKQAMHPFNLTLIEMALLTPLSKMA